MYGNTTHSTRTRPLTQRCIMERSSIRPFCRRGRNNTVALPSQVDLGVPLLSGGYGVGDFPLQPVVMPLPVAPAHGAKACGLLGRRTKSGVGSPKPRLCCAGGHASCQPHSPSTTASQHPPSITTPTHPHPPPSPLGTQASTSCAGPTWSSGYDRVARSHSSTRPAPPPRATHPPKGSSGCRRD